MESNRRLSRSLLVGGVLKDSVGLFFIAHMHVHEATFVLKKSHEATLSY